jgi:outer membrane receptor for Fe3+-dicitrate
MNNILKIFFITFIANATFAQTVLTGKVSNEDTHAPLSGVNVIIEGTSFNTVTDSTGRFEFKDITKGFHKVKISHPGFLDITVPVYLRPGINDMGTTKLVTNIYSLENKLTIGKGIVGFVEDFEAPFAVSGIPQIKIIQKSGNLDFADLLKNSPSVYIRDQAVGYGASKVNVRGFETKNLGFFVNGLPVQSLKDGEVNWSDWQGLSDILNAVQIQRGLGSAKLSTSSVGATINVLTKATDKEEGGRVSFLYGNDNYLKAVASYSTGMSKSGWGLSFLLSHWQGDGYHDGTNGQGQSYFLSLGYKPNEKHAFNLSATGAPQWHNQNDTKRLSDYDLDDDGTISNREQRYNNNWGYLDDEVYSWRKHFYHKPIASLNWDWTPNDHFELTTVLYGSFGEGGTTQPLGSLNLSGTLIDNQIDFNKIRMNNSNITPGENGLIVGDENNSVIRIGSLNLQNQWGGLSNLKYDLNEKYSLNLGIDLRSQFAKELQVVEDLVGLDGYYYENMTAPGFLNKFPEGRLFSQEYDSSPYFSLANQNPPDHADELGYHVHSRITSGNFYGQINVKTRKLFAFFQGALSNQWYQRFDYFNYAVQEEQSSDVLDFLGYSFKTGANYKINRNHKFYLNAGYHSRQPFFDDLFLNFTNEVNADVVNEELLGLELGYGLRTDLIDVDLDGYYTQWSNRQIRKGGDFDADGESDDLALYENVGQTHMGIELEFTTQPVAGFDLGGFVSIGNWEYSGNVEASVYDENRNPIEGSENMLYLDGIKVGNAAQTSFGVMASYKIMNGLTIDADWRFYDRLFASIDPESFTTEVNDGSLELPSFNLLDAGVTYRYILDNYDTLILRANFNNVLNAQFITQSDTNIHAAEGDNTYQGINASNRIYFGNGFTWNVSLAYKF